MSDRLPEGGIGDGSSEVSFDASEFKTNLPKTVKIRFTQRQYETFRDACKILDAVSQDSTFNDFVNLSLGTKSNKQIIQRQLIAPIIDAPSRIMVKKVKGDTDKSGTKEQKVSHFTKPISLSPKAEKLYKKVKNSIDKSSLKHNIDAKTTCFVDIRAILSKYILDKKLKSSDGIVIDSFLKDLAKDTIQRNEETLLFEDGNYVIPKGDRKIIMAMVDEIGRPPIDQL